MERNWYELAARAKAAIGDLKSPGVMARREAAAESLGLARQTLRNYISAHDFVDRVRASDPELADLLRRMPSLAAEIYNRWWGIDPAGAASHARIAARDGLTVRDIVAAHKNRVGSERTKSGILDDLLAGRPAGKGAGRIRPDIKAAFRRLHLQAPSLHQLHKESSFHALAKAIGVEDVLVSHERHEPGWPVGAIGVLEVPGLALSDGMRRQWRATLAKALAAAHFFPMVLVLVRTPGELEQLTENIPFGQPLAESDDPSDAGSGWQSGRALARWAAPSVLGIGDRSGSVLFSSALTFFDDYQGS